MQNRRFSKLIGSAILTLIAVAPALAGNPRSAVPRHPDDKTFVHVLNRLGFGPRPDGVERVRAMGLAKYIDQQLHPERIRDEAAGVRLADFETLGRTSRELAEHYFIPAELARREQQQQRAAGGPQAPPSPAAADAFKTERQVLVELSAQKILRAAYSERQLDEVMVDFWFNHFNVFVGKGQVRVYLTEYERDTIRPHVFGKFRDLLGAVAHSPAMLFYLDNWQSAAPPGAGMLPAGRGRLVAPAGRRARGINENYARELMELHTLGVDGGYTQKDVQEVARAFTGWTLDPPRQGGGFRFDPRMHDDGEKIVLGHRIAPGGGERDGDEVLDILARQPSTARFIATKLARRFISDAPPKSVIDRAAATFRQTDGDIRQVVRTIVTSPEFFGGGAYRAKVKSPFEFVVSAVRASGVDVVDTMPLAQALRELGMPLYGCQPPTGYSDRASAWVNTNALLARMNFAVALAGGRPRALVPTPATHLDDARAARESLVGAVLAGDVSPPTTRAIDSSAGARQLIALLLGSPEFQKR